MLVGKSHVEKNGFQTATRDQICMVIVTVSMIGCYFLSDLDFLTVVFVILAADPA